MKNKLLLLLCLPFCISFSTAQDLQKLDSLAQTLILEYGIKGIGITAVDNNKVIFSKGFGYANLNTQLNDSTYLYIASNTKAFTALAMAQLIEDKKLKYTDTIGSFIDASLFPEDIKISNISIKDLLAHTHGLSNDPLVFRTAYSGEYPSDLRELLKHTVYRTTEGDRAFNYSNLGYILAGIIIENLTEKSWQQYFEDELFPALKMEHTTATMDFETRLAALPFDHHSESILDSKKSQNTLHAAGGVYSTLPDMGQWLLLLTQKDKSTSLPDAYLAPQITTSENMGPFQMSGYGNGWISGSIENTAIKFHFGSFKGYESMISVQPEKKQGIFVFVNERIGGQRIAAMLNYYFYLLLNNDHAAAIKISEFKKMIDPLYKDQEKAKPANFQMENSDALTGLYQSEEYGQLLVDKTTEGFSFQLGKLRAIAGKGEQENELIVEWTPGIKEHFFLIENEQGGIDLKYDDFGVFEKL